MGTIWVLDTETKGTGAHMVPLEKVLRRPEERESEPIFVPPKREPRAPEPAAPEGGGAGADLRPAEARAARARARGAGAAAALQGRRRHDQADAGRGRRRPGHGRRAQAGQERRRRARLALGPRRRELAAADHGPAARPLAPARPLAEAVRGGPVPPAAVELADRRHLLVGELEAEDIEVLRDPLGRDRLG